MDPNHAQLQISNDCCPETYLCLGQLSECPNSMAGYEAPISYGIHSATFDYAALYSLPMVQRQAQAGNPWSRNIIKRQN